MRGALYPVVVAEQAVKQLQLGIAQAAAAGTGHANRAVVFHQQRAVRVVEQFGHVTVVLPQAHQAG